MQLVILRHGQAEAYASSDAQRQLTPRGLSDTLRAGECLAEQGFMFDALWVSPYRRTQQTAEQVLKSYPEMTVTTQDFLTPDISPRQVYEHIKRSGLQRLLIISHQPLVSALAALLTQANDSYGPPMAPASMAVIDSPHLLPGCGDLLALRHAPEFQLAL